MKHANINCLCKTICPFNIYFLDSGLCAQLRARPWEHWWCVSCLSGALSTCSKHSYSNHLIRYSHRVRRAREITPLPWWENRGTEEPSQKWLGLMVQRDLRLRFYSNESLSNFRLIACYSIFTVHPPKCKCLHLKPCPIHISWILYFWKGLLGSYWFFKSNLIFFSIDVVSVCGQAFLI